MAKTSNPTSTSTQKVAVNIISGLLGSGKTTAIQQLIKQKHLEHNNEKWALLINEFGQIGLDGPLLQSSDLPMAEVNGGCICCSAQYGLNQALNQLLAIKPDRILIEPTGLGHPAQVIDLIRQHPQLHFNNSIALIDPKHLTEERWEKSAVMRDLINLADIVILNKIDLSSIEEITRAEKKLKALYPPKAQRIKTTHSEFALDLLTKTYPRPPFILLASGQHNLNNQPQPFDSNLPQVLQCETQTGDVSSIGWIWSPNLRFNRVALKAFLAEQPHLVRAKGLLRTGKEWQQVQWVEDQLEFTDQAWRQDNRLELIFNTSIKVSQIEQNLVPCLTEIPTA